MNRWLCVGLAAVLLAGAFGHSAEAQASTCSSGSTDVDGGGPDVVVGLPSYDLPGKPDAGAIVVFSNVAAPGSDVLRAPVGRRLITMDDIPGLVSQAGARFGAAVLVSSDVYAADDGNYCAELVVGIPGQTISGKTAAGRVVRLSGSTAGVANLSKIWDEERLSGLGGAQTGAEFGSSLAGLNYADRLLVGAPGRDVDGVVDAGSVVSLGVSASRMVENGSGEGAMEAGDRFGEVLTLLPTCGSPLVIVGVPHEDVGTRTDAGAVVLTSQTGTQSIVHQSSPNAGDAAEAGDHYGASLAAFFSGGGSTRKGFVTIGVPGEDLGSAADAGTVSFASFAAPQPVGSSALAGLPGTLNQSSPGIAGSVSAGDQYGAAVVSGAFGASGFTDLAVTSPGEDVGSVADAGLVDRILLRDDGSADPDAPGTPWTQDSAGVPDRAEAGDHLGAAVSTTGLVDAARASLVVVTVPGEDVASVPDVGAAHVGAPSGAGSVLLVPPVYQAGAGLGMTPAQVMPSGLFCSTT